VTVKRLSRYGREMVNGKTTVLITHLP